MASWPENPILATVPDIVHNSPTSRLAASELIHFEKVMEAADVTAASVFQVRKRRRIEAENSPCAIGRAPHPARVTLGFGDSDEEDAEQEGVASDTAIARALVKTIAATTGVEAPEKLGTTHDAITWASRAILDARSAAITSTRRERYKHVMDPEQTLQAFSLMQKLDALLSGHSAGGMPSALVDHSL